MQHLSLVHANAVIGWAWSVFKDYDFKDNPLYQISKCLLQINNYNYGPVTLFRVYPQGVDAEKAVQQVLEAQTQVEAHC